VTIDNGTSERYTVVDVFTQDRVGLLFAITYTLALRAAIERVFGERVPVQRCRAHKLRNVRDHLPPHLQAQVTSAMRAAFRLAPQEGIAKLTQQPKIRPGYLSWRARA